MIVKKFNEWIEDNKALMVYPETKAPFFGKYYIPNNFRTNTLLAKHYACNTYTVLLLTDTTIKLIPGKRFHYDNSGWIITEKPWSDDEIEITLEK